jgi:hypothetical protein
VVREASFAPFHEFYGQDHRVLVPPGLNSVEELLLSCLPGI